VICMLLSIAAAVIVMSIRVYLVRRGLMKPLSMAADRAVEPFRRPQAAGREARMALPVSDMPVCIVFPACDLGHAQCAPGACSSAG